MNKKIRLSTLVLAAVVALMALSKPAAAGWLCDFFGWFCNLQC